MKYIYLLFIIIIGYLIYKYYNKYIENFDSSLIPVSSVVTLSKVSHNLLKDNTLTHPGNLQVGSNSSTGDLTVTGNTTVTDISTYGSSSISSNMQINGQTTFIGNNTITGDQSITGGQSITGNSTVNNTIKTTGDINIATKDNPTRIGKIWSSPGIYAERGKNLEIGSSPGNVYVGSVPDTPSSVSNNIIVTGNTTVSDSSTITGNSYFNGQTTKIGNLSISKGEKSPDTAYLSFGDGSGWMTRIMTNESIPSMDIYDNGNLTIYNSFYSSESKPSLDRDIYDDIYKQINIYYARYGSTWQGENDTATAALKKAAVEANKNKAFKFTYQPGTDTNGNRYDPHVRIPKSLDVIYTCGINGLTKSVNKSVGESDTITIDCN
jgi:hypothetical protein